MVHWIGRSKVQDFVTFKQAFAAGAALRKSYGSLGARMFQSTSDPNEIVIFFEWESLEKARQFPQSSEAREAMQQGGVLGRPDLYEEVESFPS